MNEQQEDPQHSSKEELEIKKLKLEIEDFRKPFYRKWNFWTIIIALPPIIIAFLSIYLPLKIDIERRTDERLYKRYLSLLSSNDKVQRQRAAIGLKDVKDIVEKLKQEYFNSEHNSILRAGILESMKEYDFDKKEITKFAWEVLKSEKDVFVKFSALKTIENFNYHELLHEFYKNEKTKIIEIQSNYRKEHVVPQNMVYIPSGEFIFGSDDGDLNESPCHVKEINYEYLIDKHEVTNKNFSKEFSGHVPDSLSNCDDCPATKVTWEKAKLYCRKLGKRLPTEAEWEKAARGIYGRKFPWGHEEVSTYTNSKSADRGKAAPISSFPKDESPFGVCDVGGNVREWTQSYYLKYSGSKYHGFDPGKDKIVVRGGSFLDPMWNCRIPTREYYSPKNWDIDIGFRCAQNIQ